MYGTVKEARDYLSTQPEDARVLVTVLLPNDIESSPLKEHEQELRRLCQSLEIPDASIV